MKIKMTLLSDVVFGNGMSIPGQEDISVLVDGKGFPFYKGGTFKGVFREELERYLSVARELKLAAIVETHSAEEIDRALSAGADIVGINNRDLRTFKTDIQNSIDLRHLIPSDKIFISESGIHTPDDIIRLRECGADAVLIGEAMVTSNDKGAMLKALRG